MPPCTRTLPRGRASSRDGAAAAGIDVVTPAGRRAGIVTVRPRDVAPRADGCVTRA